MSEKRNLFDENSDDDNGDTSLSINKDYAKRYEEWREAELKRQLEDKYGKEYEDVSSSSSDDDPDPEELKQVLSKDFFEVISSLRKKDPKIYNSDVHFFQTEKAAANSSGKSSKKQSKEKPLYLRDYERKLITERQGELSDESDTENNQDKRSQSPTYMEEQRQLKESFKKALNDDGSGDESGFLKKKEKTKEEKIKEEEDYIEWLKGNKKSLSDKKTEESLKHLKATWADPQIDEGEKFLRDYVLNKRYLEDGDPDEDNLTDDDYQDKYMADFERQYNFRYEEPDREFLKRYPRTMDQSMRQKDTRRKEHRDAVKKRKEEEKQRKKEELKVLKSLKRKEILQKIEKIKEITGNEELGLNPDELEDDFDPEAHDRKMKELFNDDYYEDADEAEDEDGLNLPPLEEELLDDGIADGNWDNWDGTDQNVDTSDTQGVGNAPHCEDPDFIMDCDYDPAAAHLKDQESSRKSAREKRKLKRQSRFGRLVRKEKPVFDPQDKTFQEYVDEYYGMDYEDLIGDIPCRFKYKSVFPNNFGLTIDEILAADDKELNQWASIKKAYTIRPESTEIYEAKVYAQKAQDEQLKRKILPSLFKHETESASQEDKKDKKNKKKRKQIPVTDELDQSNAEIKSKKKHKADEALDQSFSELHEDIAEGSSKRKKKKSKDSSTDYVNGNADTYEPVEQNPPELLVEGNTRKKKKNKDTSTDYVNSNVDANATVDQNISESYAADSSEKKKKKKKNESLTDHVSGYVESNGTVDPNPSELQTEGRSKKKKKINCDVVDHENDNTDINETTDQNPSELHAEGSSKKKKKTKKNKDSSADPVSGKADTNEIAHQSPLELLAEGSNRKKRKKNKDVTDNTNDESIEPVSNTKRKHADSGVELQNGGKKAKRSFGHGDTGKKNFKSSYRQGNVKQEEQDISDSRLKAYGLNPKKYKNKLKYGPKK